MAVEFMGPTEYRRLYAVLISFMSCARLYSSLSLCIIHHKQISNDGRRIDVPLSVARMSEVIGSQIGDDPDNDDDDTANDNDFPCPKVSGDILQKVVDYCLHYQQEGPMEKIETPLNGETIKEIVKPEWYAQYCEVDREVMFQLVAAANFLNIKPLLDLTCLAVSVSIKGKSVEELRDIFNLAAPDAAGGTAASVRPIVGKADDEAKDSDEDMEP